MGSNYANNRMIARTSGWKDSRGVRTVAGEECWLDDWAARAAESAGRAYRAPDVLAEQAETKGDVQTAGGQVATREVKAGETAETGPAGQGAAKSGQKAGDVVGGGGGDDELNLGEPPEYVRAFVARFQPAEAGTVKAIGDLNADDAVTMIRGAEDVSALLRWYMDEGDGKQRKTVGRAIQARLVELAGAPPTPE